MRKLLACLFFFLFSTPALAGVPCTPLPYNLQNGQTADATQVMANYNFIVSCLENAAAAGANSDITSLSALTTPIAPGLGGTTAFIALSPSTGSANAQVVAATQPAAFTQIANYRVIFRAGFTNTAQMTLQVASTPPINVCRQNAPVYSYTAGGEVLQGIPYEVVYDPTVPCYTLISNSSPLPVGTVIDTVSLTAVPGFLIMNGQCVASSTFAVLFNVMGSPGPGSCSAGNFQIPDGRGRVVAMADQGGSTVLSPNCPASGTITAACGATNATQTLTTAQIPQLVGITGAGTAHQHSVFVHENAHTHNYHDLGTFGGYLSGGGLGAATGYAVTNGQTTTGQITGLTIGSVSGVANDNLTAAESAHTHSVTLGAASPAPVTIVTVQPTLILNRQIKY